MKTSMCPKGQVGIHTDAMIVKTWELKKGNMRIDVDKLDDDNPLKKKILEAQAKERATPKKPKQAKQALRAEENTMRALVRPLTEMSLEKTFSVCPMGKPRMTRSDKWKKRKCVQKYRRFKDRINYYRGDFELPLYNAWIIFYYPMPKSWSNVKKRSTAGTFHMQRPDADNMHKALLDAMMKEDSAVADHRITKVWCYQGQERIEIYTPKNEDKHEGNS